MKICIIAFARTRSSMLLETISLYYGIPILGEEINKLALERQSLPSSYNFTVDYSHLDNGVLRLHPRHFFPIRILSLSEADRKAEFDLFNFKQYDQTYFIYRESISDLIASFFVAEELNTFTYQGNIKPFQNIKPIEITEKHHAHIKGQLRSEKVVLKLKEYFENNNIKYTDLFYNDIPSFVETNYPGKKTFHIETKYDYRSIIKNYDEILSLYNYYKTII